jgi:hypothetical protein
MKRKKHKPFEGNIKADSAYDPFPKTGLDDRFHEPDHGTGDLLVDSSFAVR